MTSPPHANPTKRLPQLSLGLIIRLALLDQGRRDRHKARFSGPMRLRRLVLGVISVRSDRRLATTAPMLEVCKRKRGTNQTLAADHVISIVLCLGVERIREAIERIKDVWEHLGIYVPGPEEVEVFVVRNLGGDSLGRQLAQHSLNIYEGVAAAVDEDDGGADVAGRVFGHLGELVGRADAHGLVDVVVVQLEGLVADNLEPVDDRLGAGEGVQVRVGGEFLAGGHVARLPVEEELEALVDEEAEDWRVEERLPHGGGAEDGATPEHEVEDRGGGFDE